MSKEMAESSAKAKKPQKLPSETRPTVKTSSINLVNKQLGQLSMKDVSISMGECFGQIWLACFYNQDSGGAEISEKEKKIRQLKKKLKDIEELQGRIDRGELKNPEKNQLEKLSKRQELLDQLAQLDSW